MGYLGLRTILFNNEKVAQGSTGLVLGVQSSGDGNHPEEIYIGDASYNSIFEMLAAQNIALYPEDKVAAFPDPANNLGSIITIKRATVVSVIDGKNESNYRTWVGNVKDLLDEKNYELVDLDVVKPGLGEPIVKNMTIIITRVSEGEEKEKISLPYKTITKNDANMEKGQQKVETKGVTGTKERTYHIRRENGKLVSKVLVSEKVLVEVLNEVIVKGTRPPLIKSGNYKDTINAAALQYGLTPASLYCLMMTESNGHATSGIPRGTYKGLFQYTPGAWSSLSPKAGYGGASIADPTAQIYTTAWALTHGQSGRWPTWGSCRGK